MGSAKQQTSISRVMNILQEWDKGSRTVRKKILDDFIAQNQNKTGPELEDEFAQAGSLFLARLSAWLRLTYPETWLCVCVSLCVCVCVCVCVSKTVMVKFNCFLHKYFLSKLSRISRNGDGIVPFGFVK